MARTREVDRLAAFVGVSRHLVRIGKDALAPVRRIEGEHHATASGHHDDHSGVRSNWPAGWLIETRIRQARAELSSAAARGTGVAMTGYYFGALASPVGFGTLADLSGGYTVPWATCIGLLVVGSALCLFIQACPGRGAGPATTRGVRPPADMPAVSSPVLNA